ncbi:MAG: NADAR family protein [Clostridia bacterium]|nr:NADAR family protein [Clostridia bacterium]
MVIGFWKRNDKYGFCSNWYPAEIKLEDKTFTCCEQYMMYKKAELFKNADIAEQIVLTKDPAKIKALGRKVKNFDASIWNANKENIVGTAVMAKFIQHPDLFKKLDASGDNILAESSPSDTIWGIGLANTDPDMQNPKMWKGTNLLGQIVMQVRTLIRQGETEYKML